MGFSERDFNRYLGLKERFVDEKHKEINIGPIISYDLVISVYTGHRLKLKHFILPFLVFDVPISKLQCDKLFSIGREYGARNDYYEIFSFVKNKNRNYSDIDFNRMSRKFYCSVKNIIKASKLVFWKLGGELDTYTLLYLFCRLNFLLNCIDKLSQKKKINIRSYVAFSAVHPVECLMTLYFQNLGIRTYTLQHGLYFQFKSHVPIDAILYENMISDFHFCWGEYTKNEFSATGIDPKKLLIGGYPRTHNGSIEGKSSRHTVQSNSKIRFLVLLARQKFDLDNENVLEIIKKIVEKNENYFFDFKLHPTLDSTKYKNVLGKNNFDLIPISSTVSSVMEENTYDLTISVNTAAYYESYMNGIPSLRFGSDNFENSISVSDDLFTDFETLEQGIQSVINSRNSKEYWDGITKRLKYIIGIGISNYQID